MSESLRIVRDCTSVNYPWVVMDEKDRWLKVCRVLEEAYEFIAKRAYLVHGESEAR